MGHLLHLHKKKAESEGCPLIHAIQNFDPTEAGGLGAINVAQMISTSIPVGQLHKRSQRGLFNDVQCSVELS